LCLSWGIVVMCKEEPDKLIVARNGSPLLVGEGSDGSLYVGSEISAFVKYTRNYVELENNEILVLTKDNGFKFDRRRILFASE